MLKNNLIMDIILNETTSNVIFAIFFITYLVLALYVIYNELKYNENKFESTIWILLSIFIPIVPPIVYIFMRKKHLKRTLT